MTGTMFGYGREIAMRASAIDSGASEEVFAHGNYAPFCSDLPDLFAPFDDLPDREALRSQALALNEPLKHLVYKTALDLYYADGDDTYQGVPAFDGIGLISSETNNWIGDSADSFDKSVAVPAERIIPNQFWVTRSLRLALEAEASLWDSVEESMKNIHSGAMSSLGGVEDKGPIGINFGMTVLGAIVGISAALAAPATLGGSIALTLAVYGGVKGSVDEGKALANESFESSGDSPQEICQAVRDGISKLKGQIKETEQKIEQGLKDVVANIDNGVFHIARPSLVNNQNFSGHV